MSKGWSAVLMLLLLVPSSMWSSYVVARVWTWFAEPLGAPHVTMVRAMGLSIIVGMYRYAATPTPTEEDKQKSGGELFGAFLGRATLIPALCLFVGWVYSHWI